MQQPSGDIIQASEETASRKDSHLDLALQSRNENTDSRFYYEPMMAVHPGKDDSWEVSFGNKRMRFPIWISSMTGGTVRTNEVNNRLAHSAARFGLGMGVGSARIAVEDTSREKDFNLRPILGDEIPFYLNFGIAQVEKFLKNKEVYKLKNLRNKLNADGFIIHVNPLQEWMQPEGDIIKTPPIITIRRFINEAPDIPLIVKEVGQGFGPESMKALIELPLAAIEFAAAGGTNFSKVELLRNKVKSEYLFPFIKVGHTAGEMVDMLNAIIQDPGVKRECNTVIISGGIKNFLDGYYYIQKSTMNAVYGQASEFLKHALQSGEALNEFLKYQTQGLILARSFLKIKENQ